MLVQMSTFRAAMVAALFILLPSKVIPISLNFLSMQVILLAPESGFTALLFHQPPATGMKRLSRSSYGTGQMSTPHLENTSHRLSLQRKMEISGLSDYSWMRPQR
ncbi:hypothetical protein K458DRAFT_349727 [Lentithecium fluviatile CBS 122367]|uniref:Uncharacterized protein n=1 Tax=Lentithecium fluviatile CBS 122367 TaxID=1168545 RepID=A0A6G1II21_9PLEO|nr:hypothetical protein K458DRAFT_349727 [Lentithecium fluviatile CBS 122367]